MSEFNELKKAAMAAIVEDDCSRFVRREDAETFIALLAIQAHLVKALKQAKYAIKGREHTGFIDIAIESAGESA